MKVPKEYYDEIFEFRGQWDMPSACGLKVRHHDGRPVVVVTEMYQENPGTSVTYAGKSLAEQICEAKGFSLNDIIYIECTPDTNSKLSFYDEEYYRVDFSGERPAYTQLSADEIRTLLA